MLLQDAWWLDGDHRPGGAQALAAAIHNLALAFLALFYDFGLKRFFHLIAVHG